MEYPLLAARNQNDPSERPVRVIDPTVGAYHQWALRGAPAQTSGATVDERYESTDQGGRMLSILDMTRVKRLLCLGAHCDDIEIGAGGTIMHLVKAYPQIEVRWAILAGEDPKRVEEARRSAEVFLAGTGRSEISIYGFRDGFLPFQGELVKEAFEDLKTNFEPDLILTHHDDDRHQDHRLVSQLTWNTWRDHLILEYEIMKYDGDLGRPNFYVPLSEDICREKISGLFEAFPSQAQRQWFDEDTFWSLMRLRGVECNASSRLAEAFFVRKVVA
jgi:LmbE family N-acetylglucosaminyl deacetylase